MRCSSTKFLLVSRHRQIGNGKLPHDPDLRLSGISFPVFTQLVRYIIVLYKLSTLNDPVWDLSLVRTNIDVIRVIDQVIRNIQQAMAELAEQCANGTMERAIGIFSRFKSWCQPELPASGGAVARGLAFQAWERAIRSLMLFSWRIGG